MNPKSDEVTTFVCRDCREEDVVHIIHLFAYPNEDCNLFKSIVDGYGNLYIPNIDISKSIKDQRFWCQGRIISVFDGRVYEDEVKTRLKNTGFISDDDKFNLSECSRSKINFSSETE